MSDSLVETPVWIGTVDAASNPCMPYPEYANGVHTDQAPLWLGEWSQLHKSMRWAEHGQAAVLYLSGGYFDARSKSEAVILGRWSVIYHRR